MCDRNPSPPPNFPAELQHVDCIGDTTYSKHWLLKLLVKVIEVVRSIGDVAAETFDDLDKTLEEELCCLWDMTVNKEILAYLDEFELVPVFTSVLVTRKYPRLLEISVGILANLAYDETACRKMAESEMLIGHIMDLMYMRDSPTLDELCRLLQTVLVTTDFKTVWLDAIRYQEEFLDNQIFILRSSTNAHLLMSTIRLIDAVTREDDGLAEVWCTVALLEAVLEAQTQMKWMHGSEVEIIHRLLYTFSSSVNGVTALIEMFPNLCPGLGVYLRKVCEDEPHVMPLTIYYNSLRAIIPTLDVILANVDVGQALATLRTDTDIIPCLLRVAWACQLQLPTYDLARGLLADLHVLFKDLIKCVSDAIQALTLDAGEEIPRDSELRQDLRWLIDLEKSENAGAREAFLTCCLNDEDLETRTAIICICHKLSLPCLLDLLTDD